MQVQYIDTPTVCRRYQKSTRTVHRWVQKPECAPPGFPKPVKLNRKHHWSEAELVAWERAIASSVSNNNQGR